MAALPKAAVAPDGTRYKVHYDRDWQEWQVRAYVNGKFHEGRTYFSGASGAEGREDAIQTFHHLVAGNVGCRKANPNYKIRMFGFKVGQRVCMKNDSGVTGVVVDPYEWIPREMASDAARLKLICVKWDGTASHYARWRVTVVQAPKLAKCNPFVVKAQGYDPTGSFGTKAEAVKTIRAWVKQDLIDCRRKFGSAVVIRARAYWEVAPFRGPHAPMWSRYTLHAV